MPKGELADEEAPTTGGTEDLEMAEQKPGLVSQVTVKTASDAVRDTDNLSWMPENPPGSAPMSWQRYTFVLFEHPDACIMSKYVSAFVFLLILISSVAAWIETIPSFQYPMHKDLTTCDPTCVPKAGISCEPCSLPRFQITNTLCMICFLAEYMVRFICVSGADVSPWNDIELVWPRVQKKDARGMDAFDENNDPIFLTPDDNEYDGYRHPQWAPDAPRMSGFRKTWFWFWKPLSLVDMLAVLPFVFKITNLAQHLEGMVSLRYFRLVRVFRVLKLQKQTIAVALFVNTIKLSAGPLMVLMFFVMMAIVVFGSVVYQVEQGNYCPPALDEPGTEYRAVVTVGQPVKFVSFETQAQIDFAKNGGQAKCDTITLTGQYDVDFHPDTCCPSGGVGCYCVVDAMGDGVQVSAFFSTFISMWWVLTTITTVGYGDMFPTTLMGRFVGASAMILGVVGFAMPISIIGTAFEEEYHRLAANAGSIDKMLVDHKKTSEAMKQNDGGYPNVPEPANDEERDALMKKAEPLFKTLVNACIESGYQARNLADFANDVAKKQKKADDKAA